MPIQVTCPGCHVRFSVSDKFAGREGPCPKCKAPIRIPDKSEEVVIHEPETGPKDLKGRPIAKPIARTETKLTGLHWTIIIGTIVLSLVCALMLRIGISTIPAPFLGAGALLLAIPAVYSGCAFLRDQELGAFKGVELWIRVGIVAVVYAALLALMYLGNYAFVGWTPLAWISAATVMFALGALCAMLAFEFDYLTGLLHYGLYFLICMICRTVAGVGLLPGWYESPATQPSDPPPTDGAMDMISLLFDALPSSEKLNLLLASVSDWLIR